MPETMTLYANRLLVLAAVALPFMFSSGLGSAAAPSSTTGDALSFDARLACTTVIEQAYWDAAAWPEVNPGPKPSLADVIAVDQLAARAGAPLSQTVALKERWSLSVTAGMLQAELDRMAAYSQSPERLAALFAAMDIDPGLIAECLVRPVLVERLIRAQYASDPELHAALRAAAASDLAGLDSAAQLAMLPNARQLSWEEDAALAAPADGPEPGSLRLDPHTFASRLAEVRQAFALAPGDALPLNVASPLQENAGGFYALAVLEHTPGRITLVIVEWQKRSFEEWWADAAPAYPIDRFEQPLFDYRLPRLAGVGDARGAEAGAWEYMPAMPWVTDTSESVWTGSLMLVWGGGYTTNGFRYDPVLDDWRPITTLNAPHGRLSFTAVWTGAEMIVFGGCNGGSEFCTDGSGGRYNPVTDTWETIANGRIRRQHTAVWTGTEMLVWGGCRESPSGNQNCSILVDQGARYDPLTNTWTDMSLTGDPGAMRNPVSAWAGDQMVLWNGLAGSNARYFPDSDTWEAVNTLNAPEAGRATLVWTGSELIAWGGCTGAGLCSTQHDTGGRYDPAADAWTPTGLSGAPDARSTHSAVWAGDAMIVWGGWDGVDYRSDGGRYDPQSDSWTVVSLTGAPSARGSQFAHWTGTEMIVWGGAGFGDERSGGRYSPATDTWVPTTTNDPYRVAVNHASIWDGARMISWGGAGEQFIDPFYQRARIYDPATDVWSMSSQNPDLDHFWWPGTVWTGTEMIVWGGQSGSNIFDLGARYNPLTDTWAMTSLANAPEARGSHSAVWTGTEMIVWGGSTWSQLFVNTGGRYDPQTDSWTATGLNGAPSGRYFHAAAWTGSEMLIWGGQTGTGATGTGGRYDPQTNAWTSMSTTDAPAARVMFTSVWTGSEFIVWGGGTISGGWTFHPQGGRYDPVADAWTPTSLSGAPQGRARLASVWTGQEMIVWGGCDGSSCLNDVHTGGRYNPFIDSWTATSEDHVIEGREFQTMVWTGDAMLVWGGLTNRNGYTHTGGRYLLAPIANIPPQANPDAYSLVAYAVLIVPAPGVLGNDLDANGDILAAELVGGPANGQLVLNADGGFTYTPDPGFVGQDSFSYRAFDGQAYSLPVDVTLTVEPPGATEFQIYLPFVTRP